MLGSQLSHKLNASIYALGLEFEEVETAAELRGGIGFAGEVDEFCKRAANLENANVN